MSTLWADFEKSLRRCPARGRVLMTISSLSLSYPTPLAKAAEVSYARLRGIMFGSPPTYSDHLALVQLGLVRVIEGPHGRAFEITERGRRKARQMSARAARRAVARLAVREHFYRKVKGQVRFREDAGEGPPVETFTFTWTVT